MSDARDTTGIVPDQFDDMGSMVDIDLFLHFAPWLDDPDATVVVRGLPPGILFDPARMTLQGEFGRETLPNEAYEVQVEVRVGDRVLVTTRFRWMVRDRTQRGEEYPPRRATPPMSAGASGTGAAMLFSLGAQMSMLGSARVASGQMIGTDGARSAFNGTPVQPTEGGGTRGTVKAPITGQDLTVTGSVGQIAGDETELPAAPLGRLRVDPLSRAAGSAPGDDGSEAPQNLPEADGGDDMPGPGPIIAVPGSENTAPLIDPLPPLAQIEDAPILNIDVLANAIDVDGDPVSVRSVRAETGLVIINEDSTLSYVPQRDFAGGDQITYVLDDGNGGQTTGTITITITPVNDAPTAVDDSAATNEDTLLTIDPLGNDIDPDEGDTLTIDGASSTDGTVTVRDNVIDYTPAADSNGPQTITYTVRDGDGLTSTATIAVDVAAVNDAPVALDDGASTSEDSGTILFSVTGNDTDIDNAVDPASVWIDGATAPGASVAVAGIGEWSVTDAGQIGFTPQADWNGTATIDYTVADVDGLRSAPAEVTVVVTPVNDAPTAGDPGTVTVPEDGSTSIDVIAIATDVEGDAITLLAPVSANGATVAVSPDGRSILYQPQPDVTGPDTVFYTLRDANGAETNASFAVEVSAVDDVPAAVADTGVGIEDNGPIRIDVLANDTDPDGTLDPASVAIEGAAADGTLTIAGEGVWSVEPDGALLFAPEANFDATSNVRYTVADTSGVRSQPADATIDVTPVNDAPVANDELFTTVEDTVLNLSVLANDGDVEGDALTFTIDNVTGGGAVPLGDGTIDFTPDADFVGDATIDYTIDDGNGGSDSATTTITVTPVNDAPMAVDDAFATSEDTARNVAVLANDTDAENDPLTLTIDGVTNGTALLLPDNTIDFTPDANFVGDATIDYTIDDGNGGTSSATATITVTADNDVPVAGDDTYTTAEDTVLNLAVLDNDGDVDGDTLTVTVDAVTNGSFAILGDGSIDFTPDANFVGDATIDYTIDDGNGGSDSATATVTYTAVNDAPVVTDDAASGLNSGPITINLVGSFTDPDSTLSVSNLRFADGSTQVVQPGQGTWDMDTGTGEATFTPLSTFAGDARVGFTITDGDLLSNVGELTATVSQSNLAPTDLEGAGFAGTALNIDGNNGAYLEIADAGTLFGGRTDLAFEATFTIDSTDGQSYSPLLSYAIGGTDEVEIGIESGRGPAFLVLEIGGDRVEAPGVETLLDGEGHDVAVTWDATGGAWSVSIDGIGVGSGTGLGTGTAIAGGGRAILGQEQDATGFNPNEVFSGTLETVAISSGGATLADWTFGTGGLDGTTGTIADATGPHDLTIMQVAQPGFTDARVVDTFDIGEDATGGTVIARLSTVDPNAGDTHTYSFATPDAQFEIVGDEIRVRAGATLDHETQALRTLSITTTDQGGLSHTEDLTLHIGNRNEAPTEVSGTSFATGVTFNEDGGTAGHFVSDAAQAQIDGLTAFTLEAAFAATGTNTLNTLNTIASYNAAPGGDELALTLRDTNGIQEVDIEVGSTTLRVPTNTAFLNDGARHQIGLTWDGTTGDWQLFVDGTMTNSGTGFETGHVMLGGGRLIVGHDMDNSSGVDEARDAFSGALYDVRLFGDVRSGTEIVAGQGVHVIDPALLLDYRFDDYDGTTVADAVSGSDLTFTQSPLLANTNEGFASGVAEDAVAGAVVLQLSGQDPDRADVLTYTIVNDTTGGAFTIVDDTLVVADASLLDAATDPLQTVTIRATDIQGLGTPVELFDIRVETAGGNDAPTDLIRDAFLTGRTFNTDGGNAGHYTLADGSALVSGLTAFTIETTFAAEAPSTANSSYTLFHAHDAAVADTINIAIADVSTSPFISVEIAGISHSFRNFDASGLFDGAPHTVAVGWNNAGALELIVDGVSIDIVSNFASGAVLDGSGAISLGQEFDPAGADDAEAFVGTLFGTRLFTATRTSTDLATSWNRDVDPASPGLIADWRFSQDDTSTVANVATAAPAGTDLGFANVTGAGFGATVASAVTGVSETAPDGATVMSLTTLDADGGDTHTYTINDPTGTFAISGSDVVVATGASLSAAGGPVTVSITTTDVSGITYSEDFAIDVLDAATAGGSAFRTGTPGADTLAATSNADFTAYGRGDADVLTGGRGDDLLHGQDGADTLSGGEGNDVLHGDRSRQDADAVGPTVQVNTNTFGNQSPPVIATLHDGRSLLVGYGDAQGEGSAGNIVSARFLADDGTPIGAEFAIGTAIIELAGPSGLPPLRADTLADGNVLVSWVVEDTVSGGATSDLATVVVDAATGSAAPQVQFQAAAGQAMSGPVVVPLESGGAFVVWHHDPRAVGAGTETVAAQRLDASGSPVGAVVALGTSQVNEDPTLDVPVLSAVDLGGGRILTAWASDAQTDRIVGVVHDTVSGATGSEFVLAQTTVSAISPPVMIALEDGGAFVAWYDDALGANLPTMRIHGRFVADDGSFASTTLDIGSAAIEDFDGAAMRPLRLVTTADGSVLVTYASDNNADLDGDRGASVAVFVSPPATPGAAAAATVGTEHILNTTTTFDESAAIVQVLGDGRMLAVWMHNPLNDDFGDASLVRGRFLDASGAPSGGEFDLSAIDAEGAESIDLDSVTTALTADGDVLVSFATNDGNDADGDGSSVVSVLVSTRSAGGADLLIGGAGDDLLVGDGQAYTSDLHELDPIAFWRFGGSGDDVDHSGNGHVAVRVNGNAITATGTARPNSGAAVLDGANDHIVVANDPDFDLSEGTITGFFRTDTIRDGTIISRMSNDANATGISIQVSAAGQLEVSVARGDGNPQVTLATLGNIVAGTVYQFAFTFDGTEGVLYLDGEEALVFPFAVDLVGSGQDWVLGASNAGSPPGSNAVLSNFFDGMIDDIAILPSALTEIEIGALLAANDDTTHSFADELRGGEGDDVLLGGGGDDTLDGGAGADVLDGGGGTDTADYSTATAGIDLALSATDGGGIEGAALVDVGAGGRSGDAAGDTYFSIERLVATSFDDRIYGSDDGTTANLGDGADVFDNRSTRNVVDNVAGGAGADRIYGGRGNDILSGDADMDRLYGEDGNDTLRGGTGDDILNGGAGGDALDGGAGTDTASYDGASARVALLLEATGGDGLFGDYTNSAAGGQTGDAVGDTYNSIEIFELSGLNDDLYGRSTGNDVDLGAGDDRFDVSDTSMGNDNVRGGDGDDLISTDGGADTVFGEAGNDTILSGTGNDTLFGGDGDDRLDGGAGSDIQRGEAGDDTFVGGEGADAHFGGADFDTVDYSASTSQVDILLSDTDQYGIYNLDYQNTSAGGQTGDAAGDRYDSIEQIIATDFDDRIYGSEAGVLVLLGAGDDIFDNANSGPLLADRIPENDGNDRIYGGTGNDIIQGGYGNDQLYGENGNDTIDGGEGDDTLYGGTGDDFLDGGTGNDTIDMRGDDDEFDIRDNGDGTYSIVHLNGGQDGTDTFTNVETIAFYNTGPVAIEDVADQVLTGSTGIDTLTSGGGDDTIYALDDDDVIDTGAGDDTIYAGKGNDIITAGAGSDLIDGGGNDDTVNYSGASTDYLVYRNADGSYTVEDTRPGSPDGTDILVDIKFLFFSVDGQTLAPTDLEAAAPGYSTIGSDVNVPETITGTAGNDRIDGQGGEDTIYGLGGDDLLYGENDEDFLVGGAGNDFLDGGGGDDTAVYSGNLADYTIHKNSNNTFTITDNRPGRPDGRDVIDDIKWLQFADQTVEPKDHEVESPIAFDLDGSGAIETTGQTTARDRDGTWLGETVAFDMDGDGDLEAVEWLTGGGDALLVDDSDGRAAIDMNGTRLFGNQGGTFEDGYAQLTRRDADGDGRISGVETEGLALWVDDGDAQAEAGELFTLADFGIDAISIETQIAHDGEGRELVRSHAETEDGRRIMTEDVWFAVGDDEELRLRPAQEDERVLEDAL